MPVWLIEFLLKNKIDITSVILKVNKFILIIKNFED